MTASLLTAENLNVSYGPVDRPVRAVSEASLAIAAGEIVGVAGRSGSGKSTLCAALIRSLGRNARVDGKVTFRGRDLYALGKRELRDLRRNDLAMVLQNPMTSLDPLFTIGDQISEAVKLKRSGPADPVAELRRVHLTAPEMRVGQYPHELSGGMKQRVLIAMATASAPSLLVADEPTSALDATVQEQILLLFREAREQFGTSVIIVSHDLSALRRVCDRIVVMYAGRIVEIGPTGAVFGEPAHPYSAGLIGSLPRLTETGIELSSIPGEVPSLAGLGGGCSFGPRCSSAMPRCADRDPPLFDLGSGRRSACWLSERVAND